MRKAPQRYRSGRWRRGRDLFRRPSLRRSRYAAPLCLHHPRVRRGRLRRSVACNRHATARGDQLRAVGLPHWHRPPPTPRPWALAAPRGASPVDTLPPPGGGEDKFRSATQEILPEGFHMDAPTHIGKVDWLAFRTQPTRVCVKAVLAVHHSCSQSWPWSIQGHVFDMIHDLSLRFVAHGRTPLSTSCRACRTQSCA